MFCPLRLSHSTSLLSPWGCRHSGLKALLFLFRKGISVPRGSLVLETGEALTLLDWFLERTGAHLHQHHLPSFCPPRVLVLPSRSAFCAVSYSRFSSLLSHPSYLLFSFQHFNRIAYTFAPARCLFCSAGTLPWGFSSFLFLALFFFLLPILPLTSLNISFPHSRCFSLSCALFKYLLLSEMLIKDFNPLNIQDLHLS